uniref:CUB domain-containing protein n=1 Tax=Macrostomum lignano TaxID=282301 RepID=A0A1I8IBR2_9PLAT
VAASLLSYTGGWLSPGNLSIANFSYSSSSFLLLHPASSEPACTCACSGVHGGTIDSSMKNISCRFNCTRFSRPKPPWPASEGCRWHLTGNGMLFEVNSANASLACGFGSAAVTVAPVTWLGGWTGSVTPGQTNVLFNKFQYTLTQTFNSKQYIGHAADMFMNELWPVRVALIGQSGSNKSVIRYRPYFGWSEFCLHECLAVYQANSQYLTVQQDCYRYF